MRVAVWLLNLSVESLHNSASVKKHGLKYTQLIVNHLRILPQKREVEISISYICRTESAASLEQEE